MKTLPEILDPILVKLYYNGYTDHIASITGHAEVVKNNWLSEATEAIAKELMGIIGEDEPFEFKDGRAIPMMVEEAWKNGRNKLLAEQRARLTAFIDKEK